MLIKITSNKGKVSVGEELLALTTLEEIVDDGGLLDNGEFLIDKGCDCDGRDNAVDDGDDNDADDSVVVVVVLAVIVLDDDVNVSVVVVNNIVDVVVIDDASNGSQSARILPQLHKAGELLGDEHDEKQFCSSALSLATTQSSNISTRVKSNTPLNRFD